MRFLQIAVIAAIALALDAVRVDAAGGPVTLAEEPMHYILDNGIVQARVHKRSGDLVSLKYEGLELLSAASGHPYGYWSHSPARGMRATNAITIHPSENNGERAEVSIKGFYTGGGGPRAGGTTACDIEIRYALGRGEPGVYTYSIFTHPADYPATGIGEARFGVKLNPDVFDYMTIDERRRKVMPRPEDWDQGTELNLKEARRLNTGLYKGHAEHKYGYSAIQFEIPAYGWSSSRHRIGLWFVNPSFEYLSGGATKVELTGHLDNNDGGAPTLLNYWRGSHYGGSVCVIGEGEEWSKVIGPFLIYCNSGAGHEALWKDALSRAEKESQAWPYPWVRGVDYPHAEQRGTVKGEIVLHDPQAPKLKLSNLLVGLAAPDYIPPQMRRFSGPPAGVSPAGGGDDDSTNSTATVQSSRPRIGGGPGGPRMVDWQNDAKYYQFWVRGDSRGRFTIPKVRPGTYTLHAIADGVLGGAAKANVTVRPGETVDLGRLQWKPARYGRQLWEIGIPNRSAEEFLHGDHYWQWGLYLRYTNDFPNDVNFVIGKSDYRKDWNYAQVPRGSREGTTWSIFFALPEAPRGRATLRMGIAGISVRSGIDVSVNSKPVGGTGPMQDTATVRRDGIRGYWSERNVVFDAGLLKPGTNVLQLSIPGGNPFSGVLYDYLRLELDESAKAGAGSDFSAVSNSMSR
jgi:rhamnogalacturonan endolyase